MLRSFDLAASEASPASTIAIDGEFAALRGGGEAYAAPWHWHDCVTFLVPYAGVLEFRDEDRKDKTWISEDRFAAVPAFRAHDTIAARDTHRHIVLFITDRAIRRMEGSIGSFRNLRRRMKAASFFRTTSTIRSIQELCRGDGRVDIPIRQAQHHLGLALLIQCLVEIERSEPVSAVSPMEHGATLIAEIKAFVANNVDKDLHLDHLADRFGVSRRHVTRLFREFTGFSIGDYHQLKRIEAAKQLLIDTDLPIGEIAYRVGLDSGSALARAMRRADGQSPTDVRKLTARSVKH